MEKRNKENNVCTVVIILSLISTTSYNIKFSFSFQTSPDFLQFNFKSLRREANDRYNHSISISITVKTYFFPVPERFADRLSLPGRLEDFTTLPLPPAPPFPPGFSRLTCLPPLGL
jgi:hypothetical protein